MNYWQKRMEENYKAGEMKVQEYFKRLEVAFNQTKGELQRIINDFYMQYADENGLTFAQAQIELNNAEIGSLQDFINLSKQNIDKYSQEVNNRSMKARITRYQALEKQIDATLQKLYSGKYEADAKKVMKEVYQDSYYNTWYNSDIYTGFHAEFAQIAPREVESLLEYPFNGANFSDRLWKQKDHLQTQLMESVTTMLVTGRPPQSLVNDFSKKMQSKKFDAYKLLHTESSYIISQATHKGYAEDGVEKYQILATLDSKTCGVCGEKDSNVYSLKEAVVGESMPPFHTLCRCTDVPYYDDTDMEGQTRVARDPESGENYEVPADMTYEEWHAEYIEKNKHFVKDNRRGIIKNIEIPDEISHIGGMTEDTNTAINNAIKKLTSQYDVRLDDITVESIGAGYENVPFQYVPKNVGGFLSSKLIINSDYYFNDSLESFTERIMRNYNKGILAAKNVEDLIAHELAHVMTFQTCEKYSVFENLEQEVRSQFISGVSLYADSTFDGAETIAESFVRYRNGEEISNEVMLMLEKYVVRWKK